MDVSNQDLVRRSIESWVDLFLLSSSDALVMSASGYSQAAKDIGFIADNRTIQYEECINLLHLESIRPNLHDCFRVGSNVIEENKATHVPYQSYQTVPDEILRLFQK